MSGDQLNESLKDSHLIFGLMASFGKKEYTYEDLRYLTIPFDVTETSIRSVLSRMTKNNEITNRKEGKKVFYRFCKRGSRILDNTNLSFAPPEWKNWNGKWWGLTFSLPGLKKNERYELRKRLKAYRFAFLYPGFWIRPFHDKEKISKKMEKMVDQKYCKLLLFRFHHETDINEIQKIWNISSINEEYEQGLHYLKNIKTYNIDPTTALILKMKLGDYLVKLLFKDPLLPPRFLPDNWKGGILRKKFFEYDHVLTENSKPYWKKIFE